MTERKQALIWVLPCLLFAFAATCGIAQSGPATDDFANNSNVQVYQDAQSEVCDKANNSSPEVDGLNPLACYKQPAVNGKCSMAGNASLQSQTGNICYYCQDSLPLAAHGIVIPQDDVSPNLKGFACFALEADQCYVGCIGPGTYTPPAGTTRLGTSATPEPVLATKLPLQGDVTQTANPCEPAGPKNYNVCSYPNLPRPAGCTCSQTPTPTPPPPLPAMAQMPPGNAQGSASSSCGAESMKDAAEFTPTQLALLTADLAAAKAMVAKAKTFTDKPTWDAGTQAISQKYFGNASADTQKLMRQNVNQVLGLLNGIKSVTSTIFPGGFDIYSADTSEKVVAWVHPDKSPKVPQIYLGDNFWNQLTTGPDSQPAALIHEVSHLPAGASTVDYAYGQDLCQFMVWLTNDPLGNTVGKPVTALAETKVTLSGIVGGKLTEKSPKTVMDLTKEDPLYNADNFKYFVYYVANQTSQAKQK